MPEGHVIHRAARQQTKRLGGRRVRAESPQGRFAQGAAAVDDTVLERIEARGKHLFYRFETGGTVHVHLGLFGKFRLQTPPYPEPSPNARLLLSTDDHRVHLAGATACDLLAPDEVDGILARLGPDPLIDGPEGGERLATSLARRSIAVGKAIVDQSILAGLGNVYRSEFLFLLGVHPFLPARRLDPDLARELWQLSVDELKAGERSGRIVTVRPEEVGAPSRAKVANGDRLYAYKRQGEPCRRCGTLITSADIDGRNVWWCPTCQPES